MNKTKKRPTKAQLLGRASTMNPSAKAAAKLEKERKAAEELTELYSGVVNPKPHLECRIFPLPDYCSASSVAMRELDGEDDIMSSYWADQHAGVAEQESRIAAMVADQREGVRIALVGVDGRQVNEDGVPFMDCDEWTSKTWRFLMQCFSEMNGVPDEDLKKTIRGSLPIRGSSASGSSQDEEPGDE